MFYLKNSLNIISHLLSIYLFIIQFFFVFNSFFFNIKLKFSKVFRKFLEKILKKNQFPSFSFNLFCLNKTSVQKGKLTFININHISTLFCVKSKFYFFKLLFFIFIIWIRSKSIKNIIEQIIIHQSSLCNTILLDRVKNLLCFSLKISWNIMIIHGFL